MTPRRPRLSSDAHGRARAVYGSGLQTLFHRLIFRDSLIGHTRCRTDARDRKFLFGMGRLRPRDELSRHSITCIGRNRDWCCCKLGGRRFFGRRTGHNLQGVAFSSGDHCQSSNFIVRSGPANAGRAPRLKCYANATCRRGTKHRTTCGRAGL